MILLILFLVFYNNLVLIKTNNEKYININNILSLFQSNNCFYIKYYDNKEYKLCKEFNEKGYNELYLRHFIG